MRQSWTTPPPRRYHCFDGVVDVAWADDLESYSAPDRTFHVRQVRCDDPDKNGYPGPSRWGGGRGANNPTPLKDVMLTGHQVLLK
jgi:hypothetical protein